MDEMGVSTQVCVIGGGASGIFAVKYCLEYGLSVVCYDERAQLGGLWTGADPAWSEARPDGRPFSTVHDSLMLNTSQFVTTFSDFPLPDELTPSLASPRRYLTAGEFLRYLRLYARAFGADKLIRQSAEVVGVRRVANSGDREWEVTVRQRVGDSWEERRSRHEHVIIASGLYSKPRMPQVPGLEETPVEVVHSLHARDTRDIYSSKRVLVVGGNISSGDCVQAALECGAAKVVWAFTRNPSKRSLFLVNRYPRGQRYAWDEWSNVFKFTYFPARVLQADFEAMFTLGHCRDPNEKVSLVWDRMATLDMQLLRSARETQLLEMCPVTIGSLSADSHEAVLSDGRTVAVDLCVMATGSEPSYPFLGKDVLGPAGLEGLALYSHKVPVSKSAWGLSFLHATSIVGGGFVPTEMEARWLVHQIANGRLRTEDQRLELATQAAKISYSFKEEVIREQFFDIMDSHAKDLRCQPHFWPALFSLSPWRRRVGLATVFGPLLPQLYRLRGPHARPEVAGEYVIKVARAVLGRKFAAIVLAVDLLHVGALALVAGGVYALARSRKVVLPFKLSSR